MCGIAGYKSVHRYEKGVLERMVEALYHRGPDGDGFHRDGDYAGGMRRLAIVDVAGGKQPLQSEDKQITLLYNGEIYNYRELRRALEAKGHRFHTNCDGEVIPHLYRHYGESLFEKLDGMFAVALWVSDERKLILARDIPGEKPLHYVELGLGQVAFASEIRALTNFPGLDLELNRQAIWDLPTFLWVPEPETVYRDVKALPPSHILVADDKGIQIVRYENRFNRDDLPRRDEAAVIEETRQVVEQAVISRLLSDVPVGSFLSGGLDSSIVATIAAKHLPSLDTFSVGFENIIDPYHGHADESEAAANTARLIGAKHHGIHVTAQTFRDEIDRFGKHGDQPFAVSSGFGILAVAKAAREAGIKVLLSGDGADEAFGGYSWYAYLSDRGRTPSPTSAGRVISWQSFGVTLPERLAAIDALPQSERAWAWHYYAHEQDKVRLFSKDFYEGLSSSFHQFDNFRADRQWEPVDFIAQDRNFYFPQEMLRKCDRMTMAYSVEGRVPFAAPAVLSHADKLEFSHMVGPGGTLKHVLRRAFADILSPDVVNRPKHGFNVPIDHWLRNDWSDLVEDSFSQNSALTRSGFLARDAASTARQMIWDDTRLSGHTIFSMIMLNKWLEENLNGNHR